MASNGEDMRKKLEFRKMLMRLSDRLSSENLENLKHLLKDEIPKAKLEVARQGIDLFESLEEKRIISPDNLGNLTEYLEFIERNDLCDLISQFEERGSISRPSTQKIKTDDDLNALNLTEIGKYVGKDWKMLARHLKVPEPDIQQISHMYFNDLHEASYQALSRWKDKQGEQATVKVLKRALEDMKLMSVVHKFFVV